MYPKYNILKNKFFMCELSESKLTSTWEKNIVWAKIDDGRDINSLKEKIFSLNRNKFLINPRNSDPIIIEVNIYIEAAIKIKISTS